MESVLANHPHPNLPNFEPLNHEGILSNPFSGASPQFSNHSRPYQASAMNACLKDFIALNVSRPHVSNVKNEFTQGSNNVGFMTFPSKMSLESMDPELIHEPLTFQEFEPETLCVSNVKHRRHKEHGRKNNKNLLAKGEINKGPQGKIIKGQWSLEEDRLLKLLVKRHGARNWTEIARFLTGRVGKQCRERWQNHLRPDIKKGPWSEEEEKQLIEMHMEIGSKWSQIAQRMPGRSENTIKNHWYATMRRQNSSKNSRNDKCNNKLLRDYIRSKSSSSSEYRMDFEDNSLLSTDATTQAVENMTNYPFLLEEGSSSLEPKQDHEEVVNVSPYIPRSLVADDESNSEVDHQTPSHSSTDPLEFDVEREMDFLQMLYEGYP